MIKQLLQFGSMITLVIMLGACEKAMIPPAEIDWNDYTGNWENVNAFAANIDRIVITRKENGRISVQLWGRCGRESCALGLFSYSSPDLDKPALPMQILWKDQELPLQLSITESGKLELKATEGKPDGFDTSYFSWMQTASFYQQVTQTDARSLHLTNTRINGDPEDVDNQLTSGSILIFQTNEGRLGKIQVHGNDFFLSIRWQTWSPDGTVYWSTDYFPVHKIGYYDLDLGKMDDSPDHRYSDFYWSIEQPTIRRLEPVNGAAFAVYHLE